jgi:hypothetical protein
MLVEGMADESLDHRLPANVHSLGRPVQFFQHRGGEIDVYPLNGWHHFPPIGKEAGNILALASVPTVYDATRIPKKNFEIPPNLGIFSL